MDKTDKAKISAELGFLESLRERVLEALKRYSDVMTEPQEFLFIDTAERLLKEYNQEYSHVNDLTEFDSYGGLQLSRKNCRRSL